MSRLLTFNDAVDNQQMCGPARPGGRIWRGAAAVAACLLLLIGACRNLEVVTESYGTIADARAAGAVDRGWLPQGLPESTRELRIAHDLDSNRRWGLFNFPPAEAGALRARLGAEISLEGQTCNPPRRIEWWPVLLRETLDHEQIKATGLRAYTGAETDLIIAVNWDQGRAYYWTNEGSGKD